jgi:hypothetical protein
MDEQNRLTGEEHTQGMRSFGNYDPMRRIDRGGMGEVYVLTPSLYSSAT